MTVAIDRDGVVVGQVCEPDPKSEWAHMRHTLLVLTRYGYCVVPRELVTLEFIPDN